MLNLPSLREARAAKADAIRAIINKATLENRDLTDTEQSAFDAGKADIAKIEKDIGNAEFLADMERRMDGAPVTNADRRFEVQCREYSLIRAIAHQSGMNVDAGKEIEISQELQRRFGMAPEGMLAPTQIFEKRVVTTALPAGGPGSNVIATDLLAAQYIDILRDALATGRLGARILSNLVGNVAIPRLKVSATGAWVAENAPLSPSDVQLDPVTMSPKHVGALVEVSRNMLLQSSPDIEQILRDDFAALLARAIDKGAIQGGGTSEPVGVLATSGIGDVPMGTNGLAPSYAAVCALITAVAGSNALAGSLGFLSNSKFAGKAAAVLKSTADTSSNFIMSSPGATELAGYPFTMSNLVPSNLTKGTSSGVCSALLFGNWSDLLIGYWSAFDLLVNPYESTAYTKGNVQVRAMATCDVAIRQVKSFAATKDILTT
jgi:HK97 family phage major capsid protein